MTSNVKEAYVSVNQVPTNILTWGHWIEESLDDVKELIICITGNPGLPGFYTEFASNIHQNLGYDKPVWVIGHAGHDTPPTKSLHKTPTLESNEELYNLSGQVKHKLDFIEKYCPKHVKIYLIGHSIGAWVVLELLKNESVKERTEKAFLLFPTIERMAVSSNGQIFQITRYFTAIYLYLLHLIYLLPSWVRLFIIRIYFLLLSIPNVFVRTAMKYSRPTSMEKVIFLAKDEMDTVRDLDIDHIRNVKSLLKLYYGTTDGWVPIKYYEQIMAKIPDLDAQLCEKRIDHAFCLRQSDTMAEMVAEWIRNESA